jgi:tRNA A37 methylthiotransferase MiaB
MHSEPGTRADFLEPTYGYEKVGLKLTKPQQKNLHSNHGAFTLEATRHESELWVHIHIPTQNSSTRVLKIASSGADQ